MWYAFFTLLLIACAVTFIMGFVVFEMVGFYTLVLIILGITSYFIHTRKRVRFAIVATILSIPFVCAFAGIIIATAVQRPAPAHSHAAFFTYSINDETTPFVVPTRVNVPIDPLVFSTVPWNCFGPEVLAPNLPKSLTVLNGNTPIVRGLVTAPIQTTTVDFEVRCSDYIILSYGKAVFKTCNSFSEERECLFNECGWCDFGTSHCGFCEEQFDEECRLNGVRGCSAG